MRSAPFLVAIALVSSAGAAPRAGKVVRVERRATGFTGEPRFCTVQTIDNFGQCVGTKAPELGDRMVAVDHNRVLGMLRVTSVQGYPDGCQQTTNWMIQVTPEGDLAGSRGLVLALADVTLDPRAKLISADKTPTGHSWGTDTIYAIDNNSDGNPDLEFISYACDDFGNVSTQPNGTCHEVWVPQTSKNLERLRHDRFRNCY